MIEQNLILDGTIKAGTFACIDEQNGDLYLSNVEILNQYIDVVHKKSNRLLRFLRAKTDEDPNSDGNWAQIHTIIKNFGMGSFTGEGLWVGNRYSTLRQAKLVRMVGINAN